MKNKFYPPIAILSMLTAVILLNSCNGIHQHDKSEEVEGENIYTCDTYKHQQATCAWCEGSYRYFYRLSNGSIILICEECNCMWVDPQKIDLDDAIGARTLEENLGMSESELFDESSHWATEEEAKQSKWGTIVLQNDLLIRPAANDQVITTSTVGVN